MNSRIRKLYGVQNSLEISKIAGECWKLEPEHVKLHFQKLSLLYKDYNDRDIEPFGHLDDVNGDADQLVSQSLSNENLDATNQKNNLLDAALQKRKYPSTSISSSINKHHSDTIDMYNPLTHNLKEQNQPINYLTSSSPKNERRTAEPIYNSNYLASSYPKIVQSSSAFQCSDREIDMMFHYKHSDLTVPTPYQISAAINIPSQRNEHRAISGMYSNSLPETSLKISGNSWRTDVRNNFNRPDVPVQPISRDITELFADVFTGAQDK
ncbi:hypothetical protein HDV02_001623 [Globomyces sp. JEL0801]|nr:hypothetical protein HDV02_001623 [Globomyces sp. JEL0801]